MTMSIIAPTAMTDAMFGSSTATEADYTAWNAATSYSIGDKAMRAVSGVHRNFENLIAGVNATNPEDATTGATPRWLDLGATNRWAMWDNKVGTSTAVTSPLTVVINPGRMGGLALLELVGTTATVTLKDAPAGTTVYTATKSLDGTLILSFYEWFFEEFVQLSDWALTDLPAHYTEPELTISITGTGTVECGVCKFGLVSDIGFTEYGATAGIIDFSVKTLDDFGNYSITERSYSKRNTIKVQTERVDFERFYRKLASLRATPAVYIATEFAGYAPLLVYGFYRDFSIDVTYFSHHTCSLEIEGLI